MDWAPDYLDCQCPGEIEEDLAQLFITSNRAAHEMALALNCEK